jgi:putative oxidoreductase
MDHAFTVVLVGKFGLNKLKMKYRNLIEIAAGLLILLFVYTALSKLLDLEEYRQQMEKQVFTPAVRDVLFWLVPVAELATSALLLFPRSRPIGFYVAFVLLLLFTSYILLILWGAFGHVPCSCGGVIASLDWSAHLLFNTFFLLLTTIAIYMTNRERRGAAKK